MQVLRPDGGESVLDEQVALAERPNSLDGKTVAFLDGWGHHSEHGEVEMHPFMKAVRTRLEERYRLSDTIWLKKPDISKDAPEAFFARMREYASVVVNGECA